MAEAYCGYTGVVG